MKRTPLFAAHQKLGARLIEFGGWEMPVFYTSIAEEHLATRHGGGNLSIYRTWVRFRVCGDKAADAFLNLALTNDVRKLRDGLGQYTLMCNASGGVIDDLYVYQTGASEYLMVVNASRIEADFKWMRKQWTAFPKHDEVDLVNASEAFGAVAVQGPKVAAFIDACVDRGEIVPRIWGKTKSSEPRLRARTFMSRAPDIPAKTDSRSLRPRMSSSRFGIKSLKRASRPG